MKIEIDMPEVLLARIDLIAERLEGGSRDEIISAFCSYCLARPPHLPLMDMMTDHRSKEK